MATQIERFDERNLEDLGSKWFARELKYFGCGAIGGAGVAAIVLVALSPDIPVDQIYSILGYSAGISGTIGAEAARIDNMSQFAASQI